MRIIIATNNHSKIEQIQDLFAGTPLELLTMTDAGIQGAAVEDGETLGENALKKCVYAWERTPTKHWVLADDTGLYINALDGKPGIKAARWAGPTATTEDIMNHTLRALVDHTDRRAIFKTCITLLSPDKRFHHFVGECPGQLLGVPRVPFQKDMPYSGIFLPDGHDKVWAEMTPEEENTVSHRGIALRKAAGLLVPLASFESVPPSFRVERETV